MTPNRPTMTKLLKNLRDRKVVTKKPRVLAVKPPPVQAPVEEIVVEQEVASSPGIFARMVNSVLGR